MTLALSFDWSEEVVVDGLVLSPDNLDRAKYANFIHNFLVSACSNGGYVLNLNAQWGSGKTYFLKRWQETIKDNHPVVYIDAWKQDYSDDPMLAVISSIVASFQNMLPTENQIVEKIGVTAARYMKAAGPVVLKQVIKKLTGVDAEKIEDAASKADDSGSTVSDMLDGTTGESIAKLLIDDHNQKLESVEYLRRQIKDYVEAVIAHRSCFAGPAYIFVDELDRCRPSYAVEMLEVIKHFFELDNVVFVVATDTEQLQHAVKAVYGADFDAQTYLRRFFKRRLSLVEMSRSEFISRLLGNEVEILTQWENCIPAITCKEHMEIMLTNVADNLELSLRDTEQLIDRFMAVMLNLSSGQRLNPYFLLYLLGMSHVRASEYKSVLSKKESDSATPSTKVVAGGKYYLSGVEGTIQIQLEWSSNLYVPTRNQDWNSAISMLPQKALDEWAHAAGNRAPELRERVIRELGNSISRESRDSRIAEENRLRLLRDLVRLPDTKALYKDWVEMATSID